MAWFSIGRVHEEDGLIESVATVGWDMAT
jgi:hypothetical protein